MHLPYIYIIRYIKTLTQLSVLVLVSMMFGACSDDADIHRETTEVTINLRTSSQDYSSTTLLRKIGATGYSVYNTSSYDPITGNNPDLVIYMTQDTDGENATFTWDNTNQWSSKMSLELDPDPTYYVYGYMPQNAATVAISPVTSNSVTSYANGSVLALTNLYTVSTQDVCVITGAAAETDPTNFDITDENSAEVTPGSFAVDVKKGNNYIYLLMDHIYAKLSLNFKVQGPPSNYYNLRAIKLKKVEMVTGRGEVTVTVTNGSSAPTMEYLPGASTTQTITIFDVEHDSDPYNDNGVLLTTSNYEVPAFFTPIPVGETKQIRLISTYDVYYRNNDGEPDGIVRPNCTATNDWVLRPQGQTFGAGKQISISATIIPTYLYQLTDPDLNNPTIKLQ